MSGWADFIPGGDPDSDHRLRIRKAAVVMYEVTYRTGTAVPDGSLLTFKGGDDLWVAESFDEVRGILEVD